MHTAPHCEIIATEANKRLANAPLVRQLGFGSRASFWCKIQIMYGIARWRNLASIVV